MSSTTASRITGVRPLWAVEGGRLEVTGRGFSVEPPPDVRVGGVPARLSCVSSQTVAITVPGGLEGGRTPIRIDSAPGETVYVDIGAPLATGLHQVDNPAFDLAGNLYVTFSGSRGQEAPVSIFRVRPDGSREPFVSGIPNPTSLTFDPSGRLHVSSRFDGTVYRIEPDGTPAVVASELGVACGIAFDRDGVLFVGDRSGSILRVEDGRVSTLTTLPASIAAFHLAFAPDGALFVTGPTLGSRDSVYRVSMRGEVETFYVGLGRPQGLAFDDEGRLYVVDALAGRGGVYRFATDTPGEPERLVDAGGLVGLAFSPDGTLALATSETIYRLDAGVRGLLPCGRP
ncbi:MAG: SMP-30/gluconolactonase/LRE family protein [Acidobacteria bacterium]|nr:SMP-30/gluconolactonase/LRE family protein [Acidobacteriota bacterium]